MGFKIFTRNVSQPVFRNMLGDINFEFLTVSDSVPSYSSNDFTKLLKCCCYCCLKQFPMKLLINQNSVFIFAYMATISGTLEILSTGHLQLYAVPPHSSEVRFSDNKKISPSLTKIHLFQWSLLFSHVFWEFFPYRLKSFSSTLLLLLHRLIACIDWHITPILCSLWSLSTFKALSWL